MKKNALKISLIAIALVGCNRSTKQNTDIIITQEINMEHRPMNFEQSKREGKSHSGQYYSSVDSVNQFGVGYDYVLPDSLKKKNAIVYISCWVREAELPIQGEINIGLSDAKGVKKWNGFRIKEANFKANEWCYLKDSIIYTSSDLNNDYTKIGVIAIKNNGRDLFDVDDLQIKYRFY